MNCEGGGMITRSRLRLVASNLPLPAPVSAIWSLRELIIENHDGNVVDMAPSTPAKA